MPALVNQTVTIVNKSGKIVSTSKHLVNVFNEAKSAYNERKAEIKAMRKKESEEKENERKARKQLDALALDDDDNMSRRSSRRGSEDGRSRRGSEDGRSRSGRSVRRKPVPSRAGERPPVERGISDSFYANDRPRHTQQSSRLRNDVTASMLDDEPRTGELQRRHTDGMQLNRRHHTPRAPRRRKSADSIDMDLAYGELPPPLPETKREDELELKSKMSYLQRLLDEGNCMQHSVTAIIDNLQKNPDALAAVALTLAEISNIAAKMAPGALATMKTSFPAVVALLASPQFAIAAGVGVGVTIIAFGGYKIIKKIQAKKSEERLLENGPPPPPNDDEEVMGDEDQLREISRIEKWRRGIADEQVNSVGTSVDGEFITPAATRTMIEDGRLTEADLLPIEARSEGGKSRKTRKVKSRKGGSEVSSGGKKKEKEPSVLKSLFKGKSESKKKRAREREMAFV